MKVSEYMWKKPHMKNKLKLKNQKWPLMATLVKKNNCISEYVHMEETTYVKQIELS